MVHKKGRRKAKKRASSSVNFNHGTLQRSICPNRDAAAVNKHDHETDVSNNCFDGSITSKIMADCQPDLSKVIRQQEVISDAEEAFEESHKMYDNGKTDSVNEIDMEKGVDLDEDSWKKCRGRPFKYYECCYTPGQKHNYDQLPKKDPKHYVRGTLAIHSAHMALCKPVNSIATPIEISGRSKCGMAYNGDEVVVEVLNPPYEVRRNQQTTFYGKVIEILERRDLKNVKHPLFYCTIDETAAYLMKPVCKTVPKISVLTSDSEKNFKKLPTNEVYKFKFESGKLESNGSYNIPPEKKDSFLFLVVFLEWNSNQIYPKGCVLEITEIVKFKKPIKLLRMQHRIPFLYNRETIEHVINFLSDKRHLISTENRDDLTELLVFTIDSQQSEDLDDGLSIEEKGEDFVVGVHISDVSIFVRKNEPLDNEAKQRAFTFYGENGIHSHMFPKPFVKFCSLLPGEKRLVISVFFCIDINGKILKSEIKKSLISSKCKLTYTDAQEIILRRESSIPEEVKVAINKLHILAAKMRQLRLKERSHFVEMECVSSEPHSDTPDAHHLVEELMIKANHAVAQHLMKNCPLITPLNCQSDPNKKDIEEWLKENNNVADFLLNLQNKQVLPHRKLSISCENNEREKVPVHIQKPQWKKIINLAENKNIHEAQKYICMDQCHPQQALAYHRWFSIQNCSEYHCSGQLDESEKKHFSLDIFPYTHFTSPIRRYIDIIVHRLVHATLDKVKPDYCQNDIKQICAQSNKMKARGAGYYKSLHAFKIGKLLTKKPLSTTAFVNEISDAKIQMFIPWLDPLPPKSTSLPMNLLDLQIKPKKNQDNTMSIEWHKRIYGSPTLEMPKNVNDEVLHLNPHQHVFTIPAKTWKKILKAITEGNKDQLNKILKYTGCNEHACPAGTIDNITGETEVSFKCKLTLTLSHGQTLSLQMAVDPKRYFLMPFPQLLHLAKNLNVCLEHTSDPVYHFEAYATECTKEKYASIKDYQEIWVPLLQMEAATESVKTEQSIIINNVVIRFGAKDKNIFGSFELEKLFCEKKCINLDCLCYLCIQCPYEEFQNEQYSLGVTQPVVWIGHAQVQKVENINLAFIVHFKFNRATYFPPNRFYSPDGIKGTVEMFLLSSRISRMMNAVSNLRSSELATAIALKSDKMSFRPGNEMNPEISWDKFRNNTGQGKAIKKALTSSFTLIQGPPGTGKTWVGIKLLLLFSKINKKIAETSTNPKCLRKVLYCGPSNSSVDMVAKLLKESRICPKILRIYGSTKEERAFPIPMIKETKICKDSLCPPKLQDVALHHVIRRKGKPYAAKIIKYDKKFKNMQLQSAKQSDIKEYRHLVFEASVAEIREAEVLLCTCAVSGGKRFETANVGQCIIDESAMCTEAETLIPIVCNKVKQVVLIGDHKQLQPIVKCMDTEKLGMRVSLFERYAENVEFLNIQYRMHPKICQFPSYAFYNGKLKTPSNLWQNTPSVLTNLWPKPLCPVVFCHVVGEENTQTVTTEEGNEQSKSNSAEVKQVVRIFSKLNGKITSCGNPFSVNIMSQYNAQCNKLKQALQTDFPQINVNTVVASQGSEWDFVIFSTVRSLPSFRIEESPTKGWCKCNLGFIGDHHQVNVALTRARRGLIIVGNKELLRCNAVWKSLLRWYDENGCLVEAHRFPAERPKKRF